MAKFDPNLDVEVSVKPSQDGKSKILSFYGMKNGDAAVVLDRLLLPGNGPFRKVNPLKNIEKAWSKGPVVHVMVAADKTKEFLDSGMKSIVAALLKTGSYDGDKILHLQDVADFQMNKLSNEEMKQLYQDAEVSVADLWTDYLNKVNDPETMRILKLYAEIYGNTIYGHALSLRNVMLIKAMASKYGKAPTFVLGRSTWNKYGRDVKSGAKPYPLWRYISADKISQADYDKAMADAQNAIGQGGADYDELGVTVQNKIEIEANKQLSKGKKLIPIKYLGYDIEDTYIIDKKQEDLLNSKPNISGNIQYKLNALAQEIEDKKKADNGEVIDPDGNAAMVARTSKAVAAVEELCAENGVTVTNNGGSDENRLVEGLLSYYRTQITPKMNVLKPENVEQYAEDAVQLTLIMTDVALNALKRFRHSLVYTQKEATALAPVIRRAVSKIGNAIVSEAFGDNFMAQYQQALNKLGIKIVNDEMSMADAQKPVTNMNEMRNSFYSILNKINNPYLYD